MMVRQKRERERERRKKEMGGACSRREICDIGK